MGKGIKLAADAGMLSLAGLCEEDPYALQKMRDLRNEMNTHFRADARSEALRDAVEDAARRMTPIEKPAVVESADARSADRCLVVAIGDMHYGADWRVCGLHGEMRNMFNPEVFAVRMWKLLSEIIGILHREDIHNVELMLCGDALDGMLRGGQLMKLRYGMVESCMRLAEFMTGWIAHLAVEASVSVYGVDGNHGEIRPLGSKKGEHENENLEKILMWYLAARFEDDDRVYIDPVSEKRKLIEVLGYRF